MADDSTGMNKTPWDSDYNREGIGPTAELGGSPVPRRYVEVDDTAKDTEDRDRKKTRSNVIKTEV